MIVLAIIAIAAVLALGAMGNTSARGQLVGLTRTIQQELMLARSKAIRTTKAQKVCIYSDPAPADASAVSRLIRFEWDDASTPATGAACNDEFAYVSAGYNAGLVTAAGSCNASDGKWCVVYEKDLGKERAFVLRFKDTPTAGSPNTRKAVELTYGAPGTLSQNRTFPGLQGVMQLAHPQHCHTPANCTVASGAGFQTVFGVEFTLGGGARLREGL